MQITWRRGSRSADDGFSADQLRLEHLLSLTFVRNHVKVMVACDFFVLITATFRTLYVFVIMELVSRRVLHPGGRLEPAAVPGDFSGQPFVSIRDPRPGQHLL